jgi:hypothetical protein
MDKVLYAAAIALALAATAAAWRRPAILVAQYERWCKAIAYAIGASFLWISAGYASALRLITVVLEDPGYPQQAALHRVQELATSTLREARTLAPAILALLLTMGYLDLLGRRRARAVNRNAA